MVAVAQDSHDKVQSAGKNLLLYIFSLLKTGEIHDLNNEAWIRPAEKLLEALDAIIRVERQSVSFVVHEGIAQINSHALWLDRSTLEQAQELEQYLARREAGGVIFSERPSEEQLKQFFFEFARFRPPEGCEDQMQALADQLKGKGVKQMMLAPQPLRLDGIGQGVRGVASLWYYSKAIAGMEQVLSRRPIEVKAARRTAQQLVDACGVEQDLLIALALTGREEGAARVAVDVAVLCASVGRALGLSIIAVADLTTAAILHSVGQAYPNPNPDQIGPDRAESAFALRQLVEGSSYSKLLVRRVIAAVEWRESVGVSGAVGDQESGSDRHPWSQLIGLARHFLKQVRASEDSVARSPVAVGLELLESPPGELDVNLVHVFVATIGLLPVGTLVELQNGDVAVVADIEHLRGRNLYNQRPAPLVSKRRVFLERMRDEAGKSIPERQARVELGSEGEAGEWAIQRTLDKTGWEDLVVRALFRRPSTILTQLGVK